MRVRRLVPGLFWLVVALLAAFVVFLQLLADSGNGSTAGSPSPTLAPQPTPTPIVSTAGSPSPPLALPPPPTPIVYPRPGELTPARVVKVVDGDTIDVLLPGRAAPLRVRYYGSDAPERGERCYKEATERNRDLTGEAVLLLPDARDKDRYGRLLRYVFRGDGTSIDSLLVSGGQARAWRQDGAFREELIAREEAARAQSLGCLWRQR